MKNFSPTHERFFPLAALCAAHSGGKNAKSIVIAGGGTGGHLFPGITIAQEFMARNPENKVLFVSTGNEFEKTTLSKAGFPLKKIKAAGIKGRGLWNQFKSMIIIPFGIIQAIFTLMAYKPDLVLGVGSYSAGPLVVGAYILRKKIVLHEQNILPGITNRILSYFADRIYISFEEIRSNFKPKKVYLTGNPVRRELLTLETDKSGMKDCFSILVVGGSQGAHSINMAVIECLENLAKKENYYFIHQTGTKDEKRVQDAFNASGVKGDIRSFFINMAGQYQKADMIICRSGATTVAEITAIGKPVIFIPFPFAADNHQVLNAESLSRHGAAEMILEKDLNGKVLADRVKHYESNPEALALMASKAKALGKPDAAEKIVNDIYKVLEINDKQPVI